MTVNGLLVNDMDTNAEVIGYVKWIKASFAHAVLMSQNDRRFDFPLILKKVMNMELFLNVCGFNDSVKYQERFILVEKKVISRKN